MPDWILWVAGFVVLAGLGACGVHQRDPGFHLETLPDRVLVAKTRPPQNGVSRLLTDDEVPAFLDEALELFRLVAVRRGWAPPPS